MLLYLSTGKTGQQMGRLPLAEGMPIIIFQNHDVVGDVVNGTEGIFKSIRYEVDEAGEKHAKPCVVLVSHCPCEPLPFLEKNEVVVMEDSVKIEFINPYTKKKMTFH
ncbi:hypothetical protein JB92DRAFT_2690519 [Gautieria morchelliformis]|nr:hypothetical protein JB92DRAFT_2690519 [Gautieria morchelliformis]